TISRLLPSHERSRNGPASACVCARSLDGRSIMRGREKRSAGEFRAAQEQRHPTRAGRARLHVRPRWARVTLRVLRVLCSLLIVSVVATAAAFAYLYSHYSKIVDERLASGYLTSRAGIYAAPRVLRA